MNLDAIRAGRICSFALHVIDLCIAHQASVTSWKRTPIRNATLHGREDSFHLEGLAADLVPDDATETPALVNSARARGLDAVDEGNHVHIELDYRRNRTL